MSAILAHVHGGAATMIGRGSELAVLAGMVDEIARGAGRVVAVSGAAGMGKSRLVAELLAGAVARGFTGLRGTACAYAEDVSLAPVVEALRPLVRDRSLTDDLVDLGRLFDGLPMPAPRRLGDAGLERTRLFEAISRLVHRAAGRGPVVLVVEDVHWADPGSVDALHYLARAVGDFRCLLVLTHRPAEADARLRAAFASMRRADRLTEVRLGPLPAPDVAALAAQVLGDPAPDALLDLLTARAGGVPLFVQELTVALRESGRMFRSGGRWVLGRGADGLVPPGVAELFAERVAELAPADRAVLEVISVAGDCATFDLLESVCADAALADRLDGLHAVGLVVEDLVGGELVYRPVHPLLGESVYGRLSGHVRQRRHAAVAEALGRSARVDVSRLAHHIGPAGPAVEPDRALAALSAAADRAVARGVGDEGVRHARAALAVARRCGRDDLEAGLLERLAAAATCAGMTDAAVEAWREAAGARAVDPVGQARCLVHLAQLETDTGALDEARRDLDRAAAALGGAAADDLRVDIAQVGLLLHTRAGSPAGVSDVVEELDRVASRSGHHRAAALARYARAELAGGYGTGTVAADAVDEAIAAAAGLGDPVLVASLQRISMGTAVGRGEHGVVARRAQLTGDLARAAGLPVLEVIPTAFRGIGQFQAGEWDRALATADRALGMAHRVGMPRGIALALALRALVLLHRGAVAEAAACTAEAGDVYRNRRLGRLLAAIDARIALAGGDAAGAARLAPRAGPFALPVLCHQVRAEAALQAGDGEEVARTAAALDALGFPYASAAAQRLRGLAAGPDGAALLAASAVTLDELRLPFDAATCRLELAELVADADAAAAVEAATRSMAVFDNLLAAPAGDRARRLLRRLGMRPRPRDRRPGELSDREKEVAQLVAQGMSDAAVAQRLFLSPRTVTTHLQNIYRRLGLSSRAELTRWVAEASRNT